jgi:hypothetical protein
VIDEVSEEEAMTISEFDTGRTDVAGLVISTLADHDRFELRDWFIPIIQRGQKKIAVDIRGVRPLSTDLPGAIIFGSELFRTGGGVVHLVVDLQQMKDLRQMQLHDIPVLWIPFLDPHEAINSFEPPLATAS